MVSYIIIALLFACLPLWLWHLFDWRKMLLGLLLYMPFAGMVTLFFGGHDILKLAKDLLFVLPAYFSFLLMGIRSLPRSRVPAALVAAMIAFSLIVLLQMANPGVIDFGVALIGAKIWLFYLPLVPLAALAVDREIDIVRVFRLLLATAVIPVVAGITQWSVTQTSGFAAAMHLFYPADIASVMRSQSFDYGGIYTRIPSTFTFVTQYSWFIYCMFVPAYVLSAQDPSPRWRVFARFMLLALLTAGFLSGGRSAYLFVPLALSLMAIFSGHRMRLLAGTVSMPILFVVILNLGGVDPGIVFEVSRELAALYTDDIVIGSLTEAISRFPLGQGTGMNTGPARLALEEASQLSGLENYYAKAVAELGLLGLALLLAMHMTLVAYGLVRLRRSATQFQRVLGGAVLGLIAFTLLTNGKGWPLDLDPLNVYYWVLAGLLLRIPHYRPIGKQAQPHRTTGRWQNKAGIGPRMRPVAAAVYMRGSDNAKTGGR